MIAQKNLCSKHNVGYGRNWQTLNVFMNRCVSGPSPEQSQPKKQTLASRLSEMFQASLSTECETDDDFQPDRKRIRTAELKVAINVLLY